MYWPTDPSNRHEHQETLVGNTVYIGRRALRDQALDGCDPASLPTYFWPRDSTLERCLSSRAPQALLEFTHGRYFITALSGGTGVPPRNRLRKHVNNKWVPLELDEPVPIAIRDEFAVSARFCFTIVASGASSSATGVTYHPKPQVKRTRYGPGS